MKEAEKGLDPQLWHACAGSMVQIPPLNAEVFYFPQGHAEHCHSPVDFSSSPRFPAVIPCHVAAVEYLADSYTDEVYVKIRFVPLPSIDLGFGEEKGVCENGDGGNNAEKPASFAKTLTQSDANNGGGFSVPRYCAETIFPRLDYTANPPVQTVVAKDVHRKNWKFRHIYRGTPRRHLLTTGWSIFVNQKKLVAGDSVVFLRAENGELCIGIRRAKRGIGSGNGPESSPSGRNLNVSLNGNHVVGSYNGFSLFLKEDERKEMRNGGLRSRGKVRPEDVLEAATLAANGQPFEVVYYPRARTPEFFVKASSVRDAMRIHWCSGMRFKMAFETEDSSRISWFIGTVSSVQFADPILWPNSPWRLLQVTWDEPALLQNVERVSPWLVELLSNLPAIHPSPFSSPRKKLRSRHHSDVPLDGQLQLPSFSGNPLGPSSALCCLSDNTPAGIQGARHAQFGISLSDFHPRIFESLVTNNLKSKENLSCLLTIGSPKLKLEKSGHIKKHQFLLFGQPIITEQQISHSFSTGPVSQVLRASDKSNVADVFGLALGRQNSPEKSTGTGFSWRQSLHDTGHCKVFMESEDVGRTLDLAVFGSYEELYRNLANMFGIERPNHVLYQDASGAVKQTGDEPFSIFTRTAQRLTIPMNPASSDKIGRTWITGMPNAENGIEASNKAGPLSIFA